MFSHSEPNRTSLYLVLGRVCQLVGLVLIIAAIFVPAGIYGKATFVIGTLTGGYALIFGRKLVAHSRSRGTQTDQRPGVLFLRPFRSERSVGRILLHSILLPTWIFELFYTEEEQLAEALSPIGPLVAVGDPTEKLPGLGAVRNYPSDWQAFIVNKIGEARLVLVQCGTSDGIWWEVTQVFQRVPPEKVVLLVLRIRRDSYNSFVVKLRTQTGTAIPLVAKGRSRISGLIRFDSDWSPQLLSLKAPFLRTTVSQPLRAKFRYALRPVFADLGVPWRPPPLSAFKVAFVALAMLAALAALVDP